MKPLLPCLLLVGLLDSNPRAWSDPAIPENGIPGSPYAQWERGPSSDPDYFPIGVWLQDPGNAKRYRALGINLYIGLWKGPTKDQLNALKINRMPVICDQNEIGLHYRDASTIVGWMQMDEPDNAQPGNGVGYGPPVPPGEVIQRYVAMREADPDRPIFMNLGQGVAWEGWHGRGVRSGHLEDYPEYLKGCDIASFDIYPAASDNQAVQGNLWFVPQGVSRLREWTQDRKPVWTMVETTPIKGGQGPTPGQVRSEIWMALIHGAQGICYFAHSFAPKFNETGLLDDPEMATGVRAINERIHSLAPVLNAPTVDGRVTVTSSVEAVPIATMFKESPVDLHLFAVGMRPGETLAEFQIAGLPALCTAEALDESRDLRIENGKFSDTFLPYEAHLYRIRCGSK